MTGTMNSRKHFFDDGFQQHCGAMFVQQEKLRIDARFNWKLAQQSRTETMNGGDHCAIKRSFVI